LKGDKPMSRSYEMDVQISGFNKDKKDAIIEAAQKEWDGFEDWDDSQVSEELHSTGYGELCGGETEKEFANRLNNAITGANGKPCKVVIHQTCLENQGNVYSFGGDTSGKEA